MMLGGLFIVRGIVVNARLAVARSSTLPFAFTFEEDVRKFTDAMAIGLGSLKMREDSQARAVGAG